MSERPGPPCPGIAPCVELTTALAEVEQVREQVTELENDLSRMVSARDITIRDLRAELACLRAERALEEQHNQSLIARLNAAYIGRDEAKTKLGAALVERDEAVAARDAFGQKAHQLQEQVDAMTATVTGLLLEGWWCPCAKTDKSPGIFNSDAKEHLTACRACGAARPT